MLKRIQKWWRIIFWPAVVIAALNIENVATALHIDRLLTSPWPWLNSVAAFFLSDTAFHVALVVAGGGLFAWGNYIARKWDDRTPGLWVLALECESTSGDYFGKSIFSRRYILRQTKSINQRLTHFGIEPVPLPDMDSTRSKRHVGQYLHGLSVCLRAKDIEGARALAAVYLTNLEAVGFLHLPPPDTEAGKQQ